MLNSTGSYRPVTRTWKLRDVWHVFRMLVAAWLVGFVIWVTPRAHPEGRILLRYIGMAMTAMTMSDKDRRPDGKGP